MEKKRFHIGDVLSITTSRLVSNRHVEGIYDILNFMTGDTLYTHQLPRAAEECRPYLFAQFPELDCRDKMCEDLDNEMSLFPGEEREKVVKDWVIGQAQKYGEYFMVERIPEKSHKVIDPISELVKMKYGDKNETN